MSMAQEPEFQNLPLRLAYPFLTSNGLDAEADEIKKSRDKLGAYTSSLKRAKIIALLKQKGLLDNFVEVHWRFATTPAGKRKVSWYEQLYAKFEKVGTQAGQEPLNDDESEAGTEFLLEEHLRDYLAENLGLLEPGLSLWPVDDGDAVEFQVDEQGHSRRI